MFKDSPEGQTQYEPAALAGIEPIDYVYRGLDGLIYRTIPQDVLVVETIPRYSAATVERLVQERNQWGAKLLLEMADEYAQGAKDADKDSRVFLSEANARCAIHLRRKADELESGS